MLRVGKALGARIQGFRVLGDHSRKNLGCRKLSREHWQALARQSMAMARSLRDAGCKPRASIVVFVGMMRPILYYTVLYYTIQEVKNLKITAG